MERRLVLYGLEQCAGLACDYERRLSLCKLLLYNSFGFGKVAGVYNCNAVYADSVSECFKVNGRRRIAVYVLAVCRVVLVTCHTCNAVIKDDNGRITAVVCNVNKARDTAVHKCAVTDNGYRLALVFALSALVEAVQAAYACAHTYCRVDRTERSGGTERVTAYIAAYHNAELFEYVEYASVGTSCTEYGRTNGYLGIKSLPFVIFTENDLSYLALEVFALKGEQLLALYVNAVLAAVCFDNIVKLFDNIERLYLSGKVRFPLRPA